ncbi:MAG: sensor histidine kinase [Elusimicrobiaceae bacterium]|nr:sensor histidine kinase [Elusimicrobiaceae bacterium]
MQKKRSGAKNDMRILHDLRERVKELTALHQTARIQQDNSKSIAEVFQETVRVIPPAWQYPRHTAARIVFGGREFRTDGIAVTRGKQSAEFVTAKRKKGLIEVYYLKKFPAETEGPFLAEERNLINSLAEILRSCAERREAAQALLRASRQLERRVRQRTAALQRLNIALEAEIAVRKRAEKENRLYQEQLSSLASELSLTEERERRAIAADLHDHIGQTLATAKIKLAELLRPGTAGPQQCRQAYALIEEAIQYTRSLTFELSSPILYELGFEAAVESLAEQLQEKYGFKIAVTDDGERKPLSEEVSVFLFKAVRELLVNSAKHADAKNVAIALRRRARHIEITVRDDGSGFKPRAPGKRYDGFGLFSIRERLGRVGGEMRIDSDLPKGALITLSAPLKARARKKT